MVVPLVPHSSIFGQLPLLLCQELFEVGLSLKVPGFGIITLNSWLAKSLPMGMGNIGTIARKDCGMSLKWISPPLELPGKARAIKVGPKTPFRSLSKSIPINTAQLP